MLLHVCMPSGNLISYLIKSTVQTESTFKTTWYIRELLFLMRGGCLFVGGGQRPQWYFNGICTGSISELWYGVKGAGSGGPPMQSLGIELQWVGRIPINSIQGL